MEGYTHPTIEVLTLPSTREEAETLGEVVKGLLLAPLYYAEPGLPVGEAPYTGFIGEQPYTDGMYSAMQLFMPSAEWWEVTPWYISRKEEHRLYLGGECTEVWTGWCVRFTYWDSMTSPQETPIYRTTDGQMQWWPE